MLFTQVIVYLNTIVVYNILFYIIVKINKIDTKLNAQNNEKNIQYVQKELKQIKSKSFDMSDYQVILQKSYSNLEDDIRILKHKQYCSNQDILRCSNIINCLLVKETTDKQIIYPEEIK
jgi:DNA/RNA-binding domain of Phe-tRNA-synthetase-like protein